MQIGVIGVGFVGGATAEILKEAHEILPYDKYKKKYSDPEILKEAQVVFICVPTPGEINGKIDISVIEDSLKLLLEITKNEKEKPTVIIRSTVVPGTANRLAKKYPFDFISNPEFLREKHAVEDMKKTKRIVIGADKKELCEKLMEVYRPIFPNAKYINVNLKTAEMVKYASNVMLVGQIAVANEIYQICKVFGVDYEKIKDTLLLDERIARNIDVPGHDGDLGFGGKCFPKDLKALLYASKQKGYNPDLFEEIWESNRKIRKNKDWVEIIGATSENKDFVKE